MTDGPFSVTAIVDRKGYPPRLRLEHRSGQYVKFFEFDVDEFDSLKTAVQSIEEGRGQWWQATS